MIENSKEVWHNTPHRDKRAIKAVNCTGNYIVNSKNSSNVWQAEDLQDCKNIYIGAWEKDCQDETSCGNDELCYLCANGGGLYNCIAVLYSFGANVDKQKHTFNSGYSCTILNCTDCFGCIGLRNKQYCIFNKQYAKEEYFELLARIREHMKDMPFVSPITGQVFSFGDFFPPEHSLFAYNETAANDFYPKDRAAAEGQGFLWREEEVSQHKFSEYEIPDNIKDVSDDILNQVLKCEFSGKAYKITKQELEFYRKAVLPIPRVAPMERIRRRVLALTPFRSFDRICQCTGSAPTERYQNTITHDHGAGVCGKKIETSYSPARPELVYCEQCYQQEMA